MRARDLAAEYESVAAGSDAAAAARLIAEQRLPGLLVVGDKGAPRAILTASQMVGLLVPGYVLEDPSLAGVVDEQHADRLGEALSGRTVEDCLPPEAGPPPVVDGDDTALEVAALMARERSPLVAVEERDKAGSRLLGVVTAAHLLHALLDGRDPDTGQE